MKSVLYVAAAFMIGASIYGFVDYSKTSRHKEFKTMYDEPEVKQPVVTEEKKQTEIIQPEISVKNGQSPEMTGQPVKTIAKTTKKKRKIDYESFSRAPLREKREAVIIDEKNLKAKEQ